MPEENGDLDLPGMVGISDQWASHRDFIQVWRIDAAQDAGSELYDQTDDFVEHAD
jgi:hypothetical protein